MSLILFIKIFNTPTRITKVGLDLGNRAARRKSKSK